MGWCKLFWMIVSLMAVDPSWLLGGVQSALCADSQTRVLVERRPDFLGCLVYLDLVLGTVIGNLLTH